VFSLCGIIHVSLVQGSVPRRQAWAGLSSGYTGIHRGSRPRGNRGIPFFGALQISGAHALGFSETVSHGLGMTTHLAVVVPGY
jgi:hypothetical protein